MRVDMGGGRNIKKTRKKHTEETYNNTETVAEVDKRERRRKVNNGKNGNYKGTTRNETMES